MAPTDFQDPKATCSAAATISAGFLDPYKACILLHLLIATGTDQEDIARTFPRAGGEPGTARPGAEPKPL